MSVNSTKNPLLECSNPPDGRFKQGNEYQNVIDQKKNEIRHIMSELLQFKANKQEEMLFVRSLNRKMEKSRKRMQELLESGKPLEIQKRKRVRFSPNIEVILPAEGDESTASFEGFETATMDEKSNRRGKKASIVKIIRRLYSRLGACFKMSRN